MREFDNSSLYLSSLILGGTGALFIGHWGHKLGLLENPSDRSSHLNPTPKGGGIGILAAFILSAYFIGVAWSLWIPATFIALLGFFGDRLDFSPKFRLFLQFITAITLLAGLELFHPMQISGLLLIIFLTVFIVGTANIYNFMDGINGIAAITGILGFGLLAFSNYLAKGDESFSVFAACIAFSCLGFLPFNMPKARVFMGDVGSVLLGFIFTIMVIVHSKNLLDFLRLTSFLFPFYADGLTTMTVRIKDGENLLHPHRRHLYQLLANERGIAHW